MAEGAKKRSVPISGYEQEQLISLVESHKNIIENKKCDVFMIEKKKKTWKQICTKFCSLPGTSTRTGLQLKKAWENLKARAKKSMAKEKRERTQTRGGPPPTPDETAGRIGAIIPGQMNPLENPFDDDYDTEDGNVLFI